MNPLGDNGGVVKRLISCLPFAKPYIPPRFPNRNILREVMKRPVDIKMVENKIIKVYTKKGPEVIESLGEGIIYLNETRSGKKDAPNLFTAAVRAFCKCNSALGLEFADKFIKIIPEQRVFRTMITYNNRLENHERSIQLLLQMIDSDWVNEMKSSLKFKLYGDAPEIGDGVFKPRWVFEHNHIVPLTRELYVLQYPLDKDEFVTFSGQPRIELIGKLKFAAEQPDNAALVCVKFYDEDDEEIKNINPLGLIYSPRVGWYTYLVVKGKGDASFSVEFEAPSNTKRLLLGFRAWNPNGSVHLDNDIVLRASSAQETISNLIEFAQNARQSGAKRIIFMFSGTTFVQLIRANRPIRLTRVLLERNIPVLFNYHRSSMTEATPDYQHEQLIQIPTDVTQTMLGEIATLDFGEMKKIFVVSYPHPCIPKVLYRFVANGWYTLYDARDEWEEFNKVGQAKWYNEANERYITSHCDHVTAVSRPLANKLDTYGPRTPVELLPNALGWEFLQPDYKWIGDEKTIIGYFGHLTPSWFDWDNLLLIARKRPEYYFEMIGHSAPDDLDLPDNVELLGPKSHPEINVIAARWSIGIIPFKISILADAVDPIKIYEYLALGLPTVSFRMPQIDDYPYTTTVETNEDFIKALDEMAGLRPDMNKIRKWLIENRWEDRVDKMLEMIDSTDADGIRGLEG